ncbi:MAG: response regulator transcription factor [Micropruina sp.]|uniref:response regulator n=1 Tax=Micropruina sp. TaxID=2737536 RepID=UPI0039E65E90
MDPIRVVLVDDHPVVRRGLRALLESLPGYTVVGEAADGVAAVREVQLTRPDVVLMDIRMPGQDGLEATRAIRTATPDVAVLMLTMLDEDDAVFAAMRAGARGYLLKGAEQQEIDRAIRAVAAGEAIFSPGVALRVISHFNGTAAAPAAPSEPFPELTVREREVLDLVAAGLRNAAIAERLFLSQKTVANHLSSIFAKLSVDGRHQAIIRARDEGLGRP